MAHFPLTPLKVLLDLLPVPLIYALLVRRFSLPILSLVQMAALPSFVELMASLGLSDRQNMPASQSQLETSFTQPPQMTPEPPCTESTSTRSPARSTSSPSLREAAARHHPRYSPYASISNRRGSLSSVSSPDIESSPQSPTFTFPPRSTSSRTRRYRHRVNTSDSSCDFPADMPISTYVRRKTPGTSPITPNFDSGYESSSPVAQMPFSIPTLPVLLPTSTPTDSTSAPTSPISDSESEAADNHNYYRFIRQRRTGTRLSAPARSFESEIVSRRKSVVN